MNKFIIISISFFAFLFLPNVSHGQCDSLDLTFGDDGYVDLVVSDAFDQAGQLQNSHTTPEGILLVGSMEYNGIPQGVLAYYNFDGTPKSTFALGGWVRIGTGQSNSDDYFVTDVAIQEDGKILVVGHIDLWSNYNIFYTRYNPNGTVDGSFAGFGIDYENLGGNPQRITDVIVKPNGKIQMFGNYGSGENEKIFSILLDEDGYRDDSFYPDGYVEYEGLGSNSLKVSSTALFDSLMFQTRSFHDHDDLYSTYAKLYCSNYGVGNCSYFNGSSSLEFRVGDFATYIRGTRLIEGNRLVVYGDLFKEGNFRDFVAIFNEDGILDIDFGTDGIWDYTSINFSHIGDVYFEDNHLYVVKTWITNEQSSIRKLDLQGNPVPFIAGSLENFFDIKYVKNVHRTPDGDIILAGSQGFDYRLAKMGCRGEVVISSTDERLVETELKIYPNPSQDVINIVNPQYFDQFSIYRSDGILLRSYNSSDIIDVSTLPKGIYFLSGSLKDSDRLCHEKIIKQ